MLVEAESSQTHNSKASIARPFERCGAAPPSLAGYAGHGRLRGLDRFVFPACVCVCLCGQDDETPPLKLRRLVGARRVLRDGRHAPPLSSSSRSPSSLPTLSFSFIPPTHSTCLPSHPPTLRSASRSSRRSPPPPPPRSFARSTPAGNSTRDRKSVV